MRRRDGKRRVLAWILAAAMCMSNVPAGVSAQQAFAEDVETAELEGTERAAAPQAGQKEEAPAEEKKPAPEEAPVKEEAPAEVKEQKAEETDPPADTEAKGGSDTESGSDGQTVAGAENRNDGQAVAGAEAGTDVQAAADAEGGSGAQAAADAEGGSGTQAVADAEGGSGAQAAADAENGNSAQAAADAEGGSDAQTVTGAESGNDGQAATDAEGGNEAQPGTDAEDADGALEEEGADSGTEEEVGTEEAREFLEYANEQDGYKVTVRFAKLQEIPEGLSLEIREIKKAKEPERYGRYEGITAAELERKENKEISDAHFFAYRFLRDGEEAKNLGRAEVMIEYAAPFRMEEEESFRVIGLSNRDLDQDGKKDRDRFETETEKENGLVKSITFQENHQDYEVIGTFLAKKRVPAAGERTVAGEDYRVSVSYGEEAGLYEGTTLQVREILPGEAEYQEYYEQTGTALAADGEEAQIAFIRFFDITFLAPERAEDGAVTMEKVEPAGPVNVTIEYEKPEELSQGHDIQGVHLPDGGAAPEVLEVSTQEEVQESGEDTQQVFFQSDRFSVYAVVGIETANLAAAEQSAAEDTVNYFSADVFYGGAWQDGKYVWTARSSAKNHRFNYRVSFGLGSEDSQGDFQFEPETVTITVPSTIFTTRDGEQGDTFEMSIPSLEDLQEAEENGEVLDNDISFYWYEDGNGSLIIKNFRPLDPGFDGFFEMSFMTKYSTFEYEDMSPSKEFAATITAYDPQTVELDEEGSLISGATATREDTVDPVYIDTQVELLSMEQRIPVKYDSWQSSWGTKPEDADAYTYLVWEIRSRINDNSQRYDFQMEDTASSLSAKDSAGNVYTLAGDADGQHKIPDDSVKVMGYKFNGGQANPDGIVEDEETNGLRYDYVITGFEKKFWSEMDHWEITNDVTVTVTPADSEPVYDEDSAEVTGWTGDEPYSATYSRKFTWNKPTFGGGGGGFGGWVRADGFYRYQESREEWPREYLTELGMRAGNYSRYDLNTLINASRNGQSAELNDLDYAVWAEGYATRWTLRIGGDTLNPEDYFQTPVRYEVVDDEFYISDEDKGVSSAEGDRMKSSADYEINTLRFSVNAYEARLNANQEFTRASGALSYLKNENGDYEPITFYARFGDVDSDWVEVAVYDYASKTFVSQNGAYVSADGNTLTFTGGCVGYKAETVNHHYYFRLGLVPNITVKNSDFVTDKITYAPDPNEPVDNATESIAVNNRSVTTIYQSDLKVKAEELLKADAGLTPEKAISQAKEMVGEDSYNARVWGPSRSSDADFIRVVQQVSALTKDPVSTTNKAKNKQYIIGWQVHMDETYKFGQDETGYITQNGGTFYDLLPLGAILDESSVELYDSEGELLSHTAYTIEQTDNYAGSESAGSGRTLVKITVFSSSDWYDLYYNTVHSYEALRDYGNDLYNSIAYQTGNESIANGSPDNGGVRTDGDKVTTPFDEIRNSDDYRTDYETAYMTKLDPANGDADRFIYKLRYYDIAGITAASSGITKKVKSADSNNYSGEATVRSEEGYTYRLRFQNSQANTAQDVILYDVLESGTDEKGNPSDWMGTLRSIDTSALPAELQNTLNVYYLTREEASDINMASYSAGGKLGASGVSNNLPDLSEWKLLENPSSDLTGLDIGAVAIDLSISSRQATDKDGNLGYWSGEAGSEAVYVNEAAGQTVPEGYAADYRYTLGAGEALAVYLNMDAPEGVDTNKNAYPKAYNNTYVSYLRKTSTQKDYKYMSNAGVTVTNLVVTGNVNLKKVSAQDESLTIRNIGFRLQGTSDYGTPVDVTEKTDRNGRILFENIEKGTYTLVEDSTTPDWLADSTKYTVTINGAGEIWITNPKGEEDTDGNPVTTTKEYARNAGEQTEEKALYFVVENTPRIHTDVTLYKLRQITEDNDAMVGIPDTKFKLSGISDYGTEITMVATSGEGGLTIFKDLEKGTYTLVETVANEDYLLNKAEYQVKVDEGASYTISQMNETGSWVETDLENNTPVLYNTPKYWDFDLIKVDANLLNRTLEGAQFSLTGPGIEVITTTTDEDGTETTETSNTMTATSNKNGVAHFAHLPVGDYILKEEIAPTNVNGEGQKAEDGTLSYVPDEKEYFVNITEAGEVTIGTKEKEENGTDQEEFVELYKENGVFVFPNERALDGEITIIKKWDDVDPSDRVAPQIRLEATEEISAIAGAYVTVEWLNDTKSTRPQGDEYRVYLMEDGVLMGDEDQEYKLTASGNVWTYYFPHVTLQPGKTYKAYADGSLNSGYTDKGAFGTANAVTLASGRASFDNVFQTVYPYSYTGNYQTFTAPADGWYQLEVWGAYGGAGKKSNNTGDTAIKGKGGAGGYVNGEVYLTKDSKLYVYVGATTSTKNGGWNGGGTQTNAPYGGGGATDISLHDGTWNSVSHLYSRLIVAGGGGGYNGYANSGDASAHLTPAEKRVGGNGGGAAWVGGNGIEADGTTPAEGGQLDRGGKSKIGTYCVVTTQSGFGMGASGRGANSEYSGAGGGGWYGGGQGTGNSANGSGAGGSSYAWTNTVAVNGTLLSEYYPSANASYHPGTEYLLRNVTAAVRDVNEAIATAHGYAQITFLTENASTGTISTGTSVDRSGSSTSEYVTYDAEKDNADNNYGWEIVDDNTWKYVLNVFDDNANYAVWEDAVSSSGASLADNYESDYLYVPDRETGEDGTQGKIVASDDLITFNGSETKTVTVTNRSNKAFGSLTVQKEVKDAEGNSVASAQRFSFTLILDGHKDKGVENIGGTVFTNGVTTFTLAASDGAKIFTNIPVGTAYSIVEEGNSNYNDGNGATASGTVNKDGSSALITNQLTYKEPDAVYADVALKKEVTGAKAGTENDEYEFTAVFSGLAAGLEYFMQKGETTDSFTSDASGSADAILKLKDGESVIFQSLPEGASYQFIETAGDWTPSYKVTNDASAGRIAQSGGGGETGNKNKDLATATETVDKGERITVTFTNKLEYTQNVTVMKKVVKDLGEASEETFKIDIKFENVEPGTAISALGLGRMTADDAGEAEWQNVSIKDGQYYTFRGVPTSATYTVTEAKNGFIATYAIYDDENGKLLTDDKPENDGDAVPMTDADGVPVGGGNATAQTVMASQPQTVTRRINPTFVLTNTQAFAPVKISARVAGNAADAQKQFTYTVNSSALAGQTIDLLDADGNKIGELPFDRDGKATFTLKDGDNKILNLPVGLAFTVTQDDESENGYGTTYQVAGGRIRDGLTPGGRTVNAEGEKNEILFINTRNSVDVTIVKTLDQHEAEAKDRFSFTISGVDYVEDESGYAAAGAAGTGDAGAAASDGDEDTDSSEENGNSEASGGDADPTAYVKVTADIRNHTVTVSGILAGADNAVTFTGLIVMGDIKVAENDNYLDADGKPKTLDEAGQFFAKGAGELTSDTDEDGNTAYRFEIENKYRPADIAVEKEIVDGDGNPLTPYYVAGSTVPYEITVTNQNEEEAIQNFRVLDEGAVFAKAAKEEEAAEDTSTDDTVTGDTSTDDTVTDDTVTDANGNAVAYTWISEHEIIVTDVVEAGASILVKASHVLSEDEADDMRGYVNTAVVKYGYQEFEADATLEPAPHLSVTKQTTSTPEAGVAYTLGEEITYDVTVTNDGNVAVKDIQVVDELTGNTWELESLLPGNKEIFTASHVVTEEDLQAGKVVNVAAAEGSIDNPDDPEHPKPVVADPAQVEDPTAAAENDPPIRKLITGDTPAADETFTFIFTRVTPGAPMPEGAEGDSITVQIVGAAEKEIGRILFTAPGTYEYTVREADGGAVGYTYDTSVYGLTYVVAQDEETGVMSAERTITKDGAPAEGEVVTFDFTNEYHEKTSITVNKVWEDNGNAENSRPESITVRLLANGTETAQAELDEAGGWTYTFENVDARQDGELITYTVTEDMVFGYQAEITGTAGEGFTVTNTRLGTIDGDTGNGETETEPLPTLDGDKETETATEKVTEKATEKTTEKATEKETETETETEKEKVAGTVKTGDETPLIRWIVILIAAMAVSAGSILVLRRRRRDSRP